MSDNNMKLLGSDKVIQLADKLFYIFWAGFMCTVVVRYSNLTISWLMYGLMPIMSLVCRAGVFITALIKEHDYSIRRLLWIGAFLIIAMLSYKGVGTINLLDAFLVVVLCKEIRFESFYKSMIWGLAVPFGVVVILGLFGFTNIVENFIIIVTHKYEFGITFGFVHEEAASIFLYPVFLLASLDAWRRGYRRRAAIIMIAFSLTLGIMSSDGGRLVAGILIGGALLIYNSVESKKGREGLDRICYYGAIIAPVFTAISTYILCYCDAVKDFIAGILLSVANRFILGEMIIENVPITLFGHYGVFLSGVENGDVTMYECDNLYICLPFYFGIIPTLFFFFMYYRTVRLYYRKQNAFMLMALTVTMLVCVMNNTILREVPHSLFFILALCNIEEQDHKQRTVNEHTK